jgi:hypothetical protein
MENASAQVRGIAKHTAGHHDKDGVASFIIERMLPFSHAD